MKKMRICRETMLRMWGAGLCMCLASGCAGYKIEEVGAEDDAPGYRFYEPDPYIKVETLTTVEGGATTVERKAGIVWLPNRKKRYRVDTWNFLAKADFEFSFEDGWKLTAISDKGDTSEVAAGLLDAVASVAGAGVFRGSGDPGGEFKVELYRVVFDIETGYVEGLRRVAVTPP